CATVCANPVAASAIPIAKTYAFMRISLLRANIKLYPSKGYARMKRECGEHPCSGHRIFSLASPGPHELSVTFPHASHHRNVSLVPARTLRAEQQSHRRLRRGSDRGAHRGRDDHATSRIHQLEGSHE